MASDGESRVHGRRLDRGAAVNWRWLRRKVWYRLTRRCWDHDVEYKVYGDAFATWWECPECRRLLDEAVRREWEEKFGGA